MVDSKKFFCTDLAWEYGIPLVGTATRGDIWFLLEYTGRWGAKAFEESSISPGCQRSYQRSAAPRRGGAHLVDQAGRNPDIAKATVSL